MAWPIFIYLIIYLFIYSSIHLFILKVSTTVLKTLSVPFLSFKLDYTKKGYILLKAFITAKKSTHTHEKQLGSSVS